MTKTLSVKLWITLISCCIAGGIALACSDGWGEEYGVSNFSPEIFVDSAYKPFFYSYQSYYQINHDEEQQTRFNNTNITEWSAWLKKQVSNKDLEFLLQQASGTAIDSLAGYMAGKTVAVPAGLQSFALIKQKSNKNLVAFTSYLQLAKKCEVFSLNPILFSWDVDDKPKKVKHFDASSLNKDLQTAFLHTTDVFLKERYWFQLVRSYFFNSNPQSAIDFFNSNQKSMPRNVLYYRTLAYTAGAFYKLKNYSQANYYYSKVYESCHELKIAAHYSFHPQEEKDWQATLALCTSNEEKITLWQMLGIFYADEQRSINEIYRINPASDKLDVLLARAVNKYEQKFEHQDDSPFTYDTAAAAALPAFITHIATANNTGKPWIWQMAAGYLATLNKQYADAAAWFTKAQKTVPPQKTAQAQLRILKLINTIGGASRIDDKLELQMLPDIEWLNTLDAKEMPELRYMDAYTWIKQKMALKYRLQKDVVKAECFSSQTQFYSNNNNIEALKAFLSKTSKTPYEKLCTTLSAKSLSDLYEFQAIRLTYADSTGAAIEKMQQAATSSSTELAGNPFNGRIQDCHDCDHAAAQKVKYTKLSFLKKLQEIQTKMAAGEDVFTNAVLLGNAHYNISYFGNARIFYEGKITGDSQSSPYLIDSIFRKMLTGTGMAAKYYSLAFKNATTDEQKAKCQYMLAKCDRNQWYNNHVYNNPEQYDDAEMVDFNALNGFKALKQYSNTQYYKDVIRECGYFKTYVQRQSK